MPGQNSHKEGQIMSLPFLTAQMQGVCCFPSIHAADRMAKQILTPAFPLCEHMLTGFFHQ